ncbi:MAG: F0F1 ATP synthase subunit C [Holosporaceae bacterium]|jgi:F-type H+-transporting ATPase subunit c|nr:F0F1 ATP synthase subunit C [Holosporaceae bacterium]
MSPEAARFIGAGMAVLALYGVGMGMSNLFSTWMDSVARNPEAEDKIRGGGMLGFAIVESIGLLSFLIAVLILFK